MDIYRQKVIPRSQLGSGAISFWSRPTLVWMASAQTKVGRLLKTYLNFHSRGPTTPSKGWSRGECAQLNPPY